MQDAPKTSAKKSAKMKLLVEEKEIQKETLREIAKATPKAIAKEIPRETVKETPKETRSSSYFEEGDGEGPLSQPWLGHRDAGFTG